MSKLNYTNKVALSVNPSVAAANKVQDSDMNSIKNAVNENGSYAEVQTGDMGGEFYCELEGTLSSGDLVKIKIPDGYNINTNCKISIDGGTTYYNVVDLSGNNISARGLSGRNVDLVFDGTNFVSNLDMYSTNEVKTNKVWIDGKPIYRRVWTGNTPTSSTVIDTIANFDKAINIYGTYKDNYNNFTPIQMYGSTGCIPQVSADGRVYLTPKTDGDKNKPYLLIIEYTKTTN